MTTPILFFCLFKHRKNYKIFLILLCFNVAIIGFNWIPYPTDDLLSYYRLMNEMKNGGLNFVNKFSDYRLFVVINYFIYSISLTGIYNLLPAITGFIVYFLILYTIFDYANSNNISTYSLVLTTMLILCSLPLVQIVSGIRNYLAFSIIVYLLYMEAIKKKKVYMMYYLIPVFIHPAVILIIIIRISFLFLSTINIPQKLQLIILAFCLFFLIQFTGILGNVFKSSIANYILVNLKNYTGDASGSEAFSLRVYAYQGLFLIVCIIVGVCNKIKKIRHKVYTYNLLLEGISLFSVMCMMFSYMYIANRYYIFAIMLSGISIMIFIEDTKEKLKPIISYIILVSCVAGIIYQQRSFSNRNYLDICLLINNIIECFKYTIII